MEVNTMFRRPIFRLFPLGMTLLLLTAVGGAAAQPAITIACISGSSTATQVGDPLGEWMYTVNVTWNTGQHGLSHFDLILGLGGCDCVCDLFSADAPDTAGTSNGESHRDTCTVNYFLEGFHCTGDPSIPGDEGPLLKWEYFENGCEPGASGTGEFVFYSDWAPTSASVPNNYLLYKAGPDSCSGNLTGDLPDCTCATGTKSTSWTDVKELFR